SENASQNRFAIGVSSCHFECIKRRAYNIERGILFDILGQLGDEWARLRGCVNDAIVITLTKLFEPMGISWDIFAAKIKSKVDENPIPEWKVESKRKLIPLPVEPTTIISKVVITKNSDGCIVITLPPGVEIDLKY